MLYVFVISLLLIAIGELADKSQLLALVLATRYRAWQVLVGIFIATFIVHFFTTLLGMWLGGAIPTGVMPWVSGVLFVGFGLWTLRGDSVEDEEADRGGAARFGPVLATTVAFFLAELGDKTQFMTLAIAADPGGALLENLRGLGPGVQAALDAAGMTLTGLTPLREFWAITLGSTLGMVLADAVAILVGRLLGRRLPERLLTRVSGVAFILFGLFSIVSVYL